MTSAFVSLSKWRERVNVWREWEKFLELPMREVYNIFSSGTQLWKGKNFTFPCHDALVCTVCSFWSAGCQSVTGNKQEKVQPSLSPVQLMSPYLDSWKLSWTKLCGALSPFERDIGCLIEDISYTSLKPNGASTFHTGWRSGPVVSLVHGVCNMLKSTSTASWLK